MSPSQRSKAHMERLGYKVAIVERWNPYAKIRQDLYGFIDLLCVGNGETVAVQTTSGSNVSARVKKIAEHENVSAVRNAGWRILVQGWRKNAAGKYVMRQVDCS